MVLELWWDGNKACKMFYAPVLSDDVIKARSTRL
jgi:hypothetical protein